MARGDHNTGIGGQASLVSLLRRLRPSGASLLQLPRKPLEPRLLLLLRLLDLHQATNFLGGSPSMAQRRSQV
jgi:hypothetical protein